MSVFRPLLSKQTRDIVSIYGRDKQEWQVALQKEITRENLSKQFGGLREEVADVNDLRKNPSLYKCHQFDGTITGLVDSNNNLKREVVKSG